MGNQILIITTNKKHGNSFLLPVLPVASWETPRACDGAQDPGNGESDHGTTGLGVQMPDDRAPPTVYDVIPSRDQVMPGQTKGTRPRRGLWPGRGGGPSPEGGGGPAQQQDDT